MRVNLNNTVIFDEQEWPSRFALGLGLAIFAVCLPVAGCRSKKPAAPPTAASAGSDLQLIHPPPPPAERVPAPAEVPEPPRHGGTLRVHLDAEPTTLLPLAESDAAAAQVTNGLVYETLLDCRDGTYKPGLAESWDVSNDGMRLAVRVRSGVHWHDHRAFGVLDVQGTVEPLLRTGTDAPVLRAELADVASIELVTRPRLS